MKRRLIKLLLLCIVLVLAWYFFVKKDHYTINFTYNEPPAIVLQNLKTWHRIPQPGIEVVGKAIIHQNQYQQQLKIADSTFLYRWEFNGKGDGNTKVSVHISDLNHNLKQKLQVPFIKNDFVKRSIRTVKDVSEVFKTKARTYDVKNIQDSVRNSEYCAYISLKSTTGKKASTMLQNIALVMDYVNLNEIPLTGDPFLEVTNWDRETDSIYFDFCFPIAKKDSLPPTSIVRFKDSKAFNGIKADFYGNYRDSDRAWHYILDEAERSNRVVAPYPVEVFRNDPHQGGNPLEWKALIYLPLEQ